MAPVSLNWPQEGADLHEATFACIDSDLGCHLILKMLLETLLVFGDADAAAAAAAAVAAACSCCCLLLLLLLLLLLPPLQPLLLLIQRNFKTAPTFPARKLLCLGEGWGSKPELEATTLLPIDLLF